MRFSAFAAASNMLWAMNRPELDVLLSIAARAQADPEEARREAQALAAKRAPRMDRTETARKRDGVGILAIHDELFPRAGMMDDISGGTSCETLLQDFQAMLEDPAVSAILLDIDTPGGDVTGTRSLAEHVYQARGVKPIWAYVDGMAASGGYWIASAADRIIIEPTAKLGSIGIVGGWTDTSEADAKRGIKRVTVTSEQSPLKRPDLNTEEGRALVQESVNDAAEVFVADVARNRKVSAETVLADFGRGWMLTGAKAVAAGMADEIGTFEGALAELASRTRSGNRNSGMGARTGEGGRMGLMSDIQALFARHNIRDEDAETTPGTAALEAKVAELEARERQREVAEAARIEALATERKTRIEAEAKAFADALPAGLRPAARTNAEKAYAAIAETGNAEALAALKASFDGVPDKPLTGEGVRTFILPEKPESSGDRAAQKGEARATVRRVIGKGGK